MIGHLDSRIEHLDMLGDFLITEFEHVAEEGDPAFGVFHYSGAGTTHWAGFAEAIFDAALARGMIAARPEVAHITTAEYPTPAARPANSALDCSKFETTFGLETHDWRASLGRTLDRLAQEGAR